MNTLGILGIFVVGMLLSAFFSGSETGFYRVSRLRLALDERSGDRIAKTLLWLVNRPPLFVATALVGNNLANYLTSFAILLGTRAALGGHMIAELFVPLIVAPLVFVYGELLPKKLFFAAPNRLLRLGAPFFVACFVILSPFAILLAGFGRLLQYLLGESPEQILLRLARSEIHQLLDEGKEIGILQPAQRQLAQAVSDMANHSVMRYSSPINRTANVSNSATLDEVLRIAERSQATEVLVTDDSTKTFQGYVRVSQLSSTDGPWQSILRPLAEVHSHESPLAAIVKMQDVGNGSARVLDASGRVVGIVSMSALKKPLIG